MIEFTPEEIKRSKIHRVAQNVLPESFDDKDLPTDVHLVTYRIHNKMIVDAVRAYTQVDIFDEYYDKVSGMSGELISIKSGFGRIRPNLYGKIGASKTDKD